jgi:hypothetical protein
MLRDQAAFRRPFGFHQHPHEVAFLHDQVLDAVELDFGPRPFSEEHPVADLDVVFYTEGGKRWMADRDRCSGSGFQPSLESWGLGRGPGSLVTAQVRSR